MPLFSRKPQRPDYRIRPCTARDAAGCFAVMYAAVHRGTHKYYSAAEQQAWAPSETPPPDWQERVLAGYCVAAESPSAQIIGFMTLGTDGFLDFAYVMPEWMGRGVAEALYQQIEAEARSADLRLLSTEASALARSFLLKQGWSVDARQSVIRKSVALTNYRMHKHLQPDRA